ncbi:MAG: outer membrane beta-barrel protein [Ferruginibacter sp.]|nr:outer membrane beta-barrel protein [Chitinophagaceae bacterium]
MRTNVPFVRLSVLICLLAFFSQQTRSQSISTYNGKFEIGLGLGPMFFVGDLGGSAGVGKSFIKDLDLPLTKFSKGVYFNYYPTEFIGLRVAGNLGYLEGDDAEAPNKGGAEMDRKERNLNFKTKISEAYAAIELYPTYFMERYDGLKGKLRPYVLAGAGMYHFDPQTKDVDGKWVKTAPLRLEGQGFPEYPDSKPYKLTQKNILMGFGFKYYIKENLYVGFEILHRKLFTDYVDDVSHNYYIDPIYFDQHLPAAEAVIARRIYYRGTYTFPATRPYEEFAERGDPKDEDAYFSSIIRFGWRIGGSNSGSLKQLKCPIFY